MKLVMWSALGPGCDVGLSLPPPPPPKVEHEIMLTPNQFAVCAASGDFDPPFASCEMRSSL